MPYRKYTEKMWRCSWDCGYRHKYLRRVFNHENKKHRACGIAVIPGAKIATKGID